MCAKVINVRDALSQNELLSQVHAGTEIVLVENGTPVARLVPVTTPRVAGLHNGTIWTSEDFDEPLRNQSCAGGPVNEELSQAATTPASDELASFLHTACSLNLEGSPDWSTRVGT